MTSSRIFSGLVLASVLSLLMPTHVESQTPPKAELASSAPDNSIPSEWKGKHHWDDDDDREECSMAEKDCPMGVGHRGGYRGGARCFLATFLLILAIVHILLAVQIGKDLARSKLSWVWVLIVLLAGLPAAAVYALMRIGNLAKES